MNAVALVLLILSCFFATVGIFWNTVILGAEPRRHTLSPLAAAELFLAAGLIVQFLTTSHPLHFH